MRVLVLYSKPGCHLCDDMKAIAGRVAARLPLRIEEVDITANPDLERRYSRDIPVLVAAGREIARHRISEVDLECRLRET